MGESHDWLCCYLLFAHGRRASVFLQSWDFKFVNRVVQLVLCSAVRVLHVKQVLTALLTITEPPGPSLWSVLCKNDHWLFSSWFFTYCGLSDVNPCKMNHHLAHSWLETVQFLVKMCLWPKPYSRKICVHRDATTLYCWPLRSSAEQTESTSSRYTNMLTCKKNK